LKHYLVLMSVLLVIAAASSLFAFLRVQDVQRHQDTALRSIMCFAEGFVKKSPHATSQQKRQAIRFYNEALANAHLAPCPKP